MTSTTHELIGIHHRRCAIATHDVILGGKCPSEALNSWINPILRYIQRKAIVRQVARGRFLDLTHTARADQPDELELDPQLAARSSPGSGCCCSVDARK